MINSFISKLHLILIIVLLIVYIIYLQYKKTPERE